MKKYQDVDSYIEDAAPVAQPMLRQLRKIVTTLAPEAEERISYGMPGYFYNGALVYFGAFKDHVSLFGAGSTLMKQFEAELKGYKTSKGTIQFPLDQTLPLELIETLVRARVAEQTKKSS